MIATKVEENKAALVKPKSITYHRKKNIELYYISTKAGYNLLRPFEYLLKKKIGREDIVLRKVEELIDL